MNNKQNHCWTCRHCKGSGYINNHICIECQGTGSVRDPIIVNEICYDLNNWVDREIIIEIIGDKPHQLIYDTQLQSRVLYFI